jgi:hypothetical protein
MLTVLINNEKLCEIAQQLGHHTNPQEAIEAALKRYVEYLQQQEIIQEFGTIDFYPDYDYKKQRNR